MKGEPERRRREAERERQAIEKAARKWRGKMVDPDKAFTRCLADKELMTRLERRFERVIREYRRQAKRHQSRLPRYPEGHKLTFEEAEKPLERGKTLWAELTRTIPHETAMLIAQGSTAKELARVVVNICVHASIAFDWVQSVRVGRRRAYQRWKKTKAAQDDEGRKWPCRFPEYTRENNPKTYVIRYVWEKLARRLPIATPEESNPTVPWLSMVASNRRAPKGFQRAPNKEVALIASHILGRMVTASDVTAAMKEKRWRLSRP